MDIADLHRSHALEICEKLVGIIRVASTGLFTRSSGLDVPIDRLFLCKYQAREAERSARVSERRKDSLAHRVSFLENHFDLQKGHWRRVLRVFSAPVLAL